MRWPHKILIFLLLVDPLYAGRLFESGAEENNTAATAFWHSVSSATISTTQKHSGTYSVRIQGGQSIARNFAATVTSGTFYIRAYIYFAAFCATTPCSAWTLTNAGTDSIKVRQTLSGGNPVFVLANDAAGTSVNSTYTLSTGTWYRTEVSTVIADTGGSAELRIYVGDNTSAVDTISLSNQDTLNTNIVSFTLGTSTADASKDFYFDDIAVNDSTSGGTWNGPGKIAYIEAASDISAPWTTTGTCTGGDYACTNEMPGATNDTNYISSGTTINTVEQLGVSTLSGPDSDDDIIYVHLYAHLGGSGTTGTRSGRLKLWDENSTLTNGTVISSNLGCDINGFAAAPLPYTNSIVFDAGTRVAANINNFNIGVENTTATDCRASMLWANVEWIDYTPPACTAGLNMPLLGVGGCP